MLSVRKLIPSSADAREEVPRPLGLHTRFPASSRRLPGSPLLGHCSPGADVDTPVVEALRDRWTVR